MLEVAEYTPNATVLIGQSPIRLSELSTAGQKAYKEDLEIYKLHIDKYKSRFARYNKEASSLQQIVLFI